MKKKKKKKKNLMEKRNNSEIIINRLKMTLSSCESFYFNIALVKG